MTETYEKIIHKGKVVGQRLVSDAPLPPNPSIHRHILLGRMTPLEVHTWFRAFRRAADTNTPVAADRNALYAWLRWEEMDGVVDLTSQDIQGLKGVWVALGMTQQRADELLTPLAA